jgi:hypothetical protein
MKQARDDKAGRHMVLKIVIVVLSATLALALGCAAQQGSGNPEGQKRKATR